MGYWKSKLPNFIWSPLEDLRRDYFPNMQKSYSGEGEDLILNKIFNGKRNGFYVDIGCYHPKINSNTYFFYKKGWSGLNIDANPDSILKFNNFRKRDVNLNFGISNSGETLTYYKFNESAVNTFSKSLCEERNNISWLKQIGEEKIKTRKLSDILDEQKINCEIDILDIDVEGLDLEVLKSNNWDKYKPNVVLVEDQMKIEKSFEELETFRYLTKINYQLVAKTFSTLIFVYKDFLHKIK